jgi:hypothetical protein
MSLRLFSSFIIKTKNPCINCINYIKYKYSNPYDEIYDTNPISGNCRLFGKENLVTGQIEYDYALLCRIDETQCGKKGKYFNTIIV